MQPFRMSSFISVVQKEIVEMGNVSHVKCAGGCEQKHASWIVSEIADSFSSYRVNKYIHTYTHT